MPTQIETEDLILKLVLTISSLIGLIGSTYILLKRRYNPKLFLNPMGKIMIVLAYSDILNAIVGFIGQWPMYDGLPETGAFCQTQAVMMNMANLSSAFLDLGLALNTLYVIIFNGSTTNLNDFQDLYSMASFGVPFGLSMIPILFSIPFYGNARLWCWIKDPSDRLMFFYYPLWGMILFNVISFGLVYRKLRNVQGMQSSGISSMQTLFRLIMAYTISVVVAWIPGTLNRINNYYPFAPPFLFLFLQALIAPGRGFLNALAFYFTFRHSKPHRHKSNISTIHRLNFLPWNQSSQNIQTDEPKRRHSLQFSSDFSLPSMNSGFQAKLKEFQSGLNQLESIREQRDYVVEFLKEGEEWNKNEVQVEQKSSTLKSDTSTVVVGTENRNNRNKTT